MHPWCEFIFKHFLVPQNLGQNLWFFMNSHKMSWIFHIFMDKIRVIFKFISEEYCEEYCEEWCSDFMEFLKRILNCIHRLGAWTWLGRRANPILLLLLQSHWHLPHYQLACLTELQCRYLPPWSFHRLSSGCQSCTTDNLNFVVTRILVQTRSLTTEDGAWPVQV